MDSNEFRLVVKKLHKQSKYLYFLKNIEKRCEIFISCFNVGKKMFRDKKKNTDKKTIKKIKILHYWKL